MSTQNQKQLTQDRDFLTTAEAAAFLGLSRGTVYLLARQKLLAHYQPAGKLFFRKADLVAFIESGRVPAMRSKEVANETR